MSRLRLLALLALLVWAAGAALAAPEDEEGQLKRELARAEQAQGQRLRDVGALSLALAQLYMELQRDVEAEPLLRRSLEIATATDGALSAAVAHVRFSLGRWLLRQGRWSEARAALAESQLHWDRSSGRDAPLMRYHNLSALAAAHTALGRDAEALALLQRRLALADALPEHERDDARRDVRLSIAARQQALGMLPQAAQTVHQALDGLTEPGAAAQRAEVQTRLAIVLEAQGRVDESVALLRSSLALLERFYANDPEHPDIGRARFNLGALLGRSGQFAEAQALVRRSLDLAARQARPDTAGHHTLLGMLAADQGLWAEAEGHFRRVLVAAPAATGLATQSTIGALNGLGSVLLSSGRASEAVPILSRSADLLQQRQGAEAADLAYPWTQLVSAYRHLGQHTKALALSRRLMALLSRTGGARSRTAEAPVDRRQRARTADAVAHHLDLLARNPDRQPRGVLVAESFERMQLADGSATASALAAMTARFAAGDDAIGALARRRDGVLAARAAVDAAIVADLARAAGERAASTERQLRAEWTGLTRELAEIEAQLDSRFPQYRPLTHPRPLPLALAQALLQPGEALVTHFFADDSAWAWVITAREAHFVGLRIDAHRLTRQVKAARQQMELQRGLQSVDIAALHELHQSLLGPLKPHLEGIQHLIWVPTGALQSLPPALLVASPPPAVKRLADYRAVDWLIRHHAMSVLPSVGSLQALRGMAAPAPAPRPFLGVGDPQLADDPARPGEAAARARALVARARPGPGAAAVMDVDLLRQVPSLPETADELRTMARILRAGPEDLRLRGSATERVLKGMDLSLYRTLAFATHGVMAGEAAGVVEPGLMLTPPDQGSEMDDGYLAASEVARLKLNADWVILSACNTAAADGSPGGEGLSGLARAFFYAGSRSLLVSHWPVASEATVPLTTRMIELRQQRAGLGKAQAQREAMLALMDTPGQDSMAHPAIWAPFVVVGEGR